MKNYTNFAGCGHSINVFNPESKKNIKISSHRGTWGVIASQYYNNIKKRLYLCEHEQYGDETACIIIDGDYNLIMDDVWNGFDDYEEKVEWEQYERDYLNVEIVKERKLSDDSWLIRGKFEKQNFDVVALICRYSNGVSYDFFYTGKFPKDKSLFEKRVREYLASKEV